MIVACGFDHAGFPLKEEVLKVIRDEGHEPLDLGTDSTDPVDYPVKALAVAKAVVGGDAERGVLVCGSGAGVSVAASKIDGIRAVNVHDTYTAHQGVEHDNMNIICLGARVIGVELAGDILRNFLNAEFSGEDRHLRRLREVDEIEKSGVDADVEAIAEGRQSP